MLKTVQKARRKYKSSADQVFSQLAKNIASIDSTEHDVKNMNADKGRSVSNATNMGTSLQNVHDYNNQKHRNKLHQ